MPSRFKLWFIRVAYHKRWDLEGQGDCVCKYANDARKAIKKISPVIRSNNLLTKSHKILQV